MASNTHSIDLESGSSQYLSIAHASQTGLALSSSFTIEAWIKLESALATDGRMAMVAKGSVEATGTGRYVFQLQNDGGTNYLLLYLDNGSTSNLRVAYDHSQVVGVWTHVAVTYNLAGGTAKFYVNGIQQGANQTGGVTGLNSETDPFLIGAYEINSTKVAFFDGMIDDVRVWNTERTATQIAENYNTQLVGNETNLQGYWKLNNALTDSTSNGNTLTNNGTAVFATSVPYPEDGYLAFNNASADGTATGSATSLTFAHACSGLNRKLIVGVTSIGNIACTGVTYNGVAMTGISGQNPYQPSGLRWYYMFELNAPATGSNNVVVTMASGTTNIIASAISFVGAKQSTVDSSASNFVNTGTSLTTTLTSVAENCFIVGYGSCEGSQLSAGTNTVERVQIPTYRNNWASTFTSTTYRASGSNSIQQTHASDVSVLMAVALAPFTSGTAYSMAVTVGSFTLTGVASLFNIALRMATTVGEFALTGVNALFSLGKGVLAETGSFTLTGIDTAFQVAITMAGAVGEFTLTGIDVVVNKGYNLAVTVGQFVLTGFSVRMPKFWRNVAKNVVSIRNLDRTNV